MIQKLLKPLILLALLICFFTSCEKDFQDGPRFSLRSPESRLTGYWKFEKVTQDGVDITCNFNDSIKVGIGFEIYNKKDGWYTKVKLIDISNKRILKNGFFTFYETNQLIIKMYSSINYPNFNNCYPFNYDNYMNFVILFLSNRKMELQANFENHSFYITLKKMYFLSVNE